MSGRTELTAAGGVLWRSRGGQPEVLLVHRPRHADWSLPKGKPDAGENPLQTAVREVTEETGLAFSVGARLGEVVYPVGGRSKTVSYWAMQLDRDCDGEPRPQDVDEVNDARWLSIPAATKRLTYEQDKQVLERFVERGREPARLLLIRHAYAGKRGEWHAADADRPLDERGRRQAQAIGRTLGAFAPHRLIAAPLTRCVQTALGLSERTGLQIELDARVTDHAWKQDPKAAVAKLASLAHGRRTVAVVSQGDLIGAVLDELLPPVKGGYSAKKGSVWVFCTRGGRLRAADYYPSLIGCPPD